MSPAGPPRGPHTEGSEAEAPPVHGFAPEWLTLREPYDRVARDAAAMQFDWAGLRARLRVGRATDAPVRVVDLGCGTGASLRALAERLGGRQQWRLIDHDPLLLATLPDTLSRWAFAQGGRALATDAGLSLHLPFAQLEVSWQRADLADLHNLDALALHDAQWVTASALLDLVSDDWLQAVVKRCASAGAAVCWALSVDHRIVWQPADPADATVHRLFMRDQQRDKGFGPCLGGGAVAAATQALTRAGYRVATAPSDWHADAARGPSDRALLRALIDGDAGAALMHATDDDERRTVLAWQQRRQAQLAADPQPARALKLVVGHVDLLAWPDAG